MEGLGSSNIFSFFFLKIYLKFSWNDLRLYCVEHTLGIHYPSNYILTSWWKNMKWKSKTKKTHTSHNHICLKENHPSIQSPQNTQHWLQKCTKFILSSFPPKSEDLWSNFHWLSRHFLLVQKRGRDPDVCTWWRKCCICSTNSASFRSNGEFGPDMAFHLGFVVPHFKKKTPVWNSGNNTDTSKV